MKIKILCKKDHRYIIGILNKFMFKSLIDEYSVTRNYNFGNKDLNMLDCVHPLSRCKKCVHSFRLLSKKNCNNNIFQPWK